MSIKNTNTPNKCIIIIVLTSIKSLIHGLVTPKLVPINLVLPYKSFLNSNNNKATYKEFFGCSGTSIYNIRWFFKKKLTPSTLQGHNFFNSIPFFTIFDTLNAPIGGIQVLFKHHKQWSLTFGFGLP